MSTSEYKKGNKKRMMYPTVRNMETITDTLLNNK